MHWTVASMTRVRVSDAGAAEVRAGGMAVSDGSGATSVHSICYYTTHDEGGRPRRGPRRRLVLGRRASAPPPAPYLRGLWSPPAPAHAAVPGVWSGGLDDGAGVGPRPRLLVDPVPPPDPARRRAPDRRPRRAGRGCAHG